MTSVVVIGQIDDEGGRRIGISVYLSIISSELNLSCGTVGSAFFHTRALHLSSDACIVASPRTCSDVWWGSSSRVILRSYAHLGDGLFIMAGFGFPSAVGSGWNSAHRGDGRLGSGSGVGLEMSSSTGQMEKCSPLLSSTHSTKLVKIPQGHLWAGSHGTAHLGWFDRIHTASSPWRWLDSPVRLSLINLFQPRKR